MKLTPKKCRNLAQCIELHLEESGYENSPTWELINHWIAVFIKEEIEDEASEFFYKATNLSEGLR
jgi:hypothetical protein